jgi:tight adherence protein B
MNDIDLWPANLMMGATIALGAYSCQDYYDQGLDLVERDFAEKLRTLRRSVPRLRRHLKLWSALVAAVFVGLTVFLDSPIFGLLLAALLVCLPWYVLRRMAQERKRQIEDQLADAMVALSGAIKAGLSLAQSLRILADQCPKPISQEFRQIVGEYEMGKPLDRTLTEAKARLRSENFSLFAAAMLASRESGGRLNETVDRIAHSVLEMQRLERKILSETAQARKSAVYMALTPLFILFVYYFVDTENTMRLFNTMPGQLLLSISAAFNLTAYLWARVILNPDI